MRDAQMLEAVGGDGSAPEGTRRDDGRREQYDGEGEPGRTQVDLTIIWFDGQSPRDPLPARALPRRSKA